MRLPLRVNLRGLVVRRSATLLTLAGVSLMIAVFAVAWALDAGMTRALSLGGDPSLLLVLRKGSKAETNSGIDRADVPVMTAVPGIDQVPASGGGTESVASAERVVIINQPRRGQPEQSANLIVRGVGARAGEMRQGFRIVEGRDFVPGTGEAIVSRGIAERFAACGLGEQLVMRKRPFTIVGIFEAPGTPYESEVWADATEIGETHDRSEGYSSVLLRVSDPLVRARVEAELEGDERLAVDVMGQPEYFESLVAASGALKVLSVMLTAFLSIGACFAAANTMHASVLSRAREIGTLRALGFSRTSILVSCLVESLVLALVAGIMGLGIAALALLGTGHVGTSNWQSFSEMTFQLALTWDVAVVVLVASALIGFVGGLLPALRAARMPIVEALRSA